MSAPLLGSVTILGHSRGNFFFSSPARPEMMLRMTEMTRAPLIELAGLGYWEGLYPGISGHGRTARRQWDYAANDLMFRCYAVGYYEPAGLTVAEMHRYLMAPTRRPDKPRGERGIKGAQ